jgi:hypothetical protein
VKIAATLLALLLPGVAWGQGLPGICGPAFDQPCTPGGLPLEGPAAWPMPTLPADPGILGQIGATGIGTTVSTVTREPAIPSQRRALTGNPAVDRATALCADRPKDAALDAACVIVERQWQQIVIDSKVVTKEEADDRAWLLGYAQTLKHEP